MNQLSYQLKILSQLTPYELNPQMSKARVSAFRKYGNDNQTWITEDVASMMINNLIGTPIVGHYDLEKNDFTHHFTVETTKAYGYVPEDLNFRWEKRIQQTGEEYEYACFDVVLWTDRYEQAKQILSKGQSMQLNPKKTKFITKMHDNKLYYEFTETYIYGLCVLGDDVRPCFDAAFFYSENENLFERMKEQIKSNFTKNKQSEGSTMKYCLNLPQENVCALFELLFPEGENGERVATSFICNISDNQVITFNPEEKKYSMRKYSVDENGVYSLGEEQEVSMSFVASSDYADLCAIKNEISDAGFESVKEMVSHYTEEQERLNSENETLKTESSEHATKMQTYEDKINELTGIVDGYRAKEQEETRRCKNELINRYAAELSEDFISEVRSHIDDYNLEQLEGTLAINFSRKFYDQGKLRVPQVHDEENDVVLAALKKHMIKRGNK